MIAIKSALRKRSYILLNSISICIGIASVYLINSISNYCLNSAQQMLDRMGMDGYMITASSITANDMICLNKCANIKEISPILSAVSFETRDNKTKCIGGNSQIKDIYSVEIIKGKFYSFEDVDLCNNVCVISSNTAINKYKTLNCTGQSISLNINSVPIAFKIIGIYKSDKLSDMANMEYNEPIYMPYTALPSFNQPATTSVILQSSNHNNDVVSQDIALLCDGIFGQNNYSLTNIAAERSKIDALMELIKSILEVIVSVSIVVSIFGLMSTTIINIKHRQKEIGLKIALGARRKSIISEVALESIIIAVTGSLNGFLLYILINMCLNKLQMQADISLFLVVPVITIISAVIVSILPGFIAANVSPANTLKGEN